MVDCRKHIEALFITAQNLALCGDPRPTIYLTQDIVIFHSINRRQKIGFSSQLMADFYWLETPLNNDQSGLYFNELGKDGVFLPDKIHWLNHVKKRNKEANQAMFCVALWLNFTVEDAAVLASAYGQSYAMDLSLFGQWPKHVSLFPTVCDEHNIHSFSSLPSDDFAFYPIVDSATWVDNLAQQDVSIVQLRMKDASVSDIAKAIERSVLVCDRLIVNDHWPLALKYQAFGVHLGQEDIETADLLAIQQASLRLGISTHGYFEILKAMALKPSYIALGHVFPTPTKVMPSQPQGLARLRLYQSLIAEQCPTFAIGGMDLHRASSVYQTGVTGIAAVRCIKEADSVRSVLDQFLQIKTASQKETYAE